jgi:hypothetical protein
VGNIVDVLRALSSDSEWIGMVDANILRESADKIERLCSAGDALLDRLNDWHNGAPFDIDTELIKTWQEARDG